mmetsp:Transcript_7085/g.27152  ORF Transcript_7085/g.27152 Transcript_7085/m.27152 type:complete len:500 (+) Transcript_7085:1067-2566(+)
MRLRTHPPRPHIAVAQAERRPVLLPKTRDAGDSLVHPANELRLRGVRQLLERIRPNLQAGEHHHASNDESRDGIQHRTPKLGPGDTDERNHAAQRIAPVMPSVRDEHGTVYSLRHPRRRLEKKLLRHNAEGRHRHCQPGEVPGGLRLCMHMPSVCHGSRRTKELLQAERPPEVPPREQQHESNEQAAQLLKATVAIRMVRVRRKPTHPKSAQGHEVADQIAQAVPRVGQQRSAVAQRPGHTLAQGQAHIHPDAQHGNPIRRGVRRLPRAPELLRAVAQRERSVAPPAHEQPAHAVAKPRGEADRRVVGHQRHRGEEEDRAELLYPHGSSRAQHKQGAGANVAELHALGHLGALALQRHRMRVRVAVAPMHSQSPPARRSASFPHFGRSSRRQSTVRYAEGAEAAAELGRCDQQPSRQRHTYHQHTADAPMHVLRRSVPPKLRSRHGFYALEANRAARAQSQFHASRAALGRPPVLRMAVAAAGRLGAATEPRCPAGAHT